MASKASIFTRPLNYMRKPIFNSDNIIIYLILTCIIIVFMFKCRKFPWKITLTFNNIWWSVGWKKQTFNYPICSYTVFSTHHRLLNSLNSNLFNSRCFSRFFRVMFNQLRNRRRNFYIYISISVLHLSHTFTIIIHCNERPK